MKRQKRAAAVSAIERVYDLHGLQVPQSDEEDTDQDDDLDTDESDSSGDSDNDAVPLFRHFTSATGFVHSSGAEWKTAEGTFSNPHTFTADSGVKVDTSNFKHSDFIKLFLTSDLINLLVEQTNLYAEQYIASHDSKAKSRVHKWKNTDPDEMVRFIAMLWLMGFIRKPTLES